MLTLLSFLFVAGSAYSANQYFRKKTHKHLGLLTLTSILALIFMFLDPHTVLAAILIIAVPIGMAITLIMMIIGALKKKKVRNLGITLIASFLVLIMATTAFGINHESTDPATENPGETDVVEGSDNEPPFEDPDEEPGDPSQNDSDQDPSNNDENDSPDPESGDTQPDEEETDQDEQEDSEDGKPGNNEDTPSGTVTVHFIDVGQGDSTLIETPGKTVLIDGGTRSAGSTVISYLNNRGIKTLDLVISTHPHEDHIGGLLDVLNNFSVKEIIDPGVAHTSKTFENYIDLIYAKDINFTEAKPGQTIELGGAAKLQIIAPRSPSSSDLNNASVVARVTYGSTSFLFTGDAEQEAEQELINSGYTLSSTVLKVGHHGSETSTTQSFLNKVSPKYATISAGSGNRYEHPRQRVLDRLKAANINTYRTDTHGNIVITSDGSKVSVSTTRSANPETVFTGADTGSNDPGDPGGDEEEEDEEEDEEEELPVAPGDDEGKYIGSRNSDKYHHPDCRYATSINPENRVWFKDAQAAQDAGYDPCGSCKPPS